MVAATARYTYKIDKVYIHRKIHNLANSSLWRSLPNKGSRGTRNWLGGILKPGTLRECLIQVGVGAGS